MGWGCKYFTVFNSTELASISMEVEIHIYMKLVVCAQQILKSRLYPTAGVKVVLQINIHVSIKTQTYIKNILRGGGIVERGIVNWNERREEEVGERRGRGTPKLLMSPQKGNCAYSNYYIFLFRRKTWN